MFNGNEATSPESPGLILNQDQAQRLESIAQGLTKDQLNWSSGYLAGRAFSLRNVKRSESSLVEVAAQEVAPASNDVSVQTLTILYGSQTGNGRELARQMLVQAQNRGINAQLVDMADYSPRNLAKERWIALVVSTHGEGDAPDDAELLLDFLNSKRAPKLDSLSYFLLALGDSSYVKFCQTGRDFDARLQELGAQLVSERVECDVDYEESAALWLTETLQSTQEQFSAPGSQTVLPQQRASLQVVENLREYSKSNPFNAEVLVNQRITGSLSSKTVHHLELSLEGSGLSYQPGDSIGVVITNPPSLVDEVIQFTGAESLQVRVNDELIELREALSTRTELTLNSGVFLEKYSQLINNPELLQRVSDAGQRAELLSDYQVIDVLRKWPFLANGDAAQVQRFVNTLRPLSPRVYSISSSAEVTPDEVHITVAHVSYDAFGWEHEGAASTALVEAANEGDLLPVYVDSNPRFRLPENPDTNVIMIGPGTGVAPFRSFVQHRVELGSQGRNWLFFGDRNFDEDFLYQKEWQHFLHDNHIRLDVAFSRDQQEKLYVQHRMLENAEEIFAWLEEGALIYVCGDAERMAPDVHDALRSIVESCGSMTPAAAEDYLTKLKRNKRYLRDVY